MSESSIASAFTGWPLLNQRLVECVKGLDERDLALTAGPGRWPAWAVLGHAACQRVFWLCDFAGEPGAESTPFTNAAWSCPGDEDLEHVLDADALVQALSSTFAIVTDVLRRWSVADLDEVLTQPTWDGDWRFTRGAVLQRVQAHDYWHAAELNEALTMHGRTGVDPWSASSEGEHDG